jgi:hypothetical protein
MNLLKILFISTVLALIPPVSAKDSVEKKISNTEEREKKFIL